MEFDALQEEVRLRFGVRLVQHDPDYLVAYLLMRDWRLWQYRANLQARRTFTLHAYDLDSFVDSAG